MTDSLSKLFGSASRVKLLRLFLFNPRALFTLYNAAQRARVPLREARQEIVLFRKVGLVKRASRAKTPQFALNQDFAYRDGLQQLLVGALTRHEDIHRYFGGTGSIKCIVLSGIFMGEWEGTIDILVVGERLQERRVKEKIRRLEAQLGRELRYAVLTPTDFMYRLNMNDKLVRDVFDYPHKIVLDKLNIGLK